MLRVSCRVRECLAVNNWIYGLGMTKYAKFSEQDCLILDPLGMNEKVPYNFKLIIFLVFSSFWF